MQYAHSPAVAVPGEVEPSHREVNEQRAEPTRYREFWEQQWPQTRGILKAGAWAISSAAIASVVAGIWLAVRFLQRIDRERRIRFLFDLYNILKDLTLIKLYAIYTATLQGSYLTRRN